MHRTIRDRLYKYFTYNYMYRYIDVLPKLVKAYNNTVHRTTGMAHSPVTDSDAVAIWKRVEAVRRRVRVKKIAAVGSTCASVRTKFVLPWLPNINLAPRLSGSR